MLAEKIHNQVIYIADVKRRRLWVLLHDADQVAHQIKGEGMRQRGADFTYALQQTKVQKQRPSGASWR